MCAAPVHVVLNFHREHQITGCPKTIKKISILLYYKIFVKRLDDNIIKLLVQFLFDSKFIKLLSYDLP